MRKKAYAILFAAVILGLLSTWTPAPVLGVDPRQASLQKASASGIQAVLPWEQANTSGFGVVQAYEVSALDVFNGYIYAGTSNALDGARIYRSADGTTWNAVTQPGFGIAHDIIPYAILDMTVFNQRLYASTGRGGDPGQIWRSSNGLAWSPMTINGFGDPNLTDVTAFAVYGSMIYAAAHSQVSGASIWRSQSGDSNTWTQVYPKTPGAGAAWITGFAEFGGALYAAAESSGSVQVLRSTSGDWTTVVNNGFGDSQTTISGGLAVFGGFLYVGAGNLQSGAQIYRTSNGTSWEPAITPAFGDPNNQAVEMVCVFQNELYAGVRNASTGIEIWRSPDGAAWEQANLDGFGDSGNSDINASSASADFLSGLYVGTSNLVGGGEIWRHVPASAPTPTPLPSQPPATPTATLVPTSQPPPAPTATLKPPNVLLSRHSYLPLVIRP